ncbi:gamma-glutamylcyclotransferase (GGCT)/AIG2-like uncharacterized protein YtfP [Anoxybacillus vitaminiphilus]|uniref:Gamma-glutamylcyclotransferase family protein n=1 Tax=Paranoxybacillus vitaminiphilus TaxID=581036 RepID=A0A327YAZ6_9BACL|nr:gamma-glutamylcyclotransferase family protein [Anoxybacillus vitaminiphilus]RAK17156.1 gamma-glutamylcyclotransferase (GGCT)/AIG2-like uncharacterized protein YtfP [Anoxybacillus vitaminiphilus]
MNKTFHVFVYGTLRQHEPNHYLLKKAKCLARQCWTYGVLYDTGFRYPAMVSGTKQRVYGELYEVNEDQLKRLDWLEGYEGEGMANEYDRIIQTVYTDSGTVQAYMYVYSPEKVTTLTEIKSGDWKCHKLSKE